MGGYLSGRHGLRSSRPFFDQLTRITIADCKGYTCLVSLLSNHWIQLSPWKVGDFWSARALPPDDIEWLIEFGDIDCLDALHTNYGMAAGLLLSCSSKVGPYGRIGDERWLRCIALLGSNEALHVEEDSDEGGPDTLHWDIHKAFVEAATVCPKSPSGAIVLGRLFQDMPTKASADTHVDQDSLWNAVDSWNVPIEKKIQTTCIVACVFSGILWATNSLAQSSRDYAQMGEASWIAFECSTYASFADDEANRSRLLDFGYRQGKQFLAAMASGKIEKRDLESIPPFTLLFKGPSHDFVLGQTYAAAQTEPTEYVLSALDNEMKKHRGSKVETLKRQIATERFKVRNCQLVVK
jgi:hypothetical protein